MKEHLQRVLSENKAQQARVLQLNVRNGIPLFPVLNEDELEIWLVERLGSAASTESIGDPEMLRLPGVDEELAALVIRQNPDHIQFWGQTLQVTYRNGHPPSVKLEDLAWRELPDEGVFLPSGRMVRVSVKVSSHDSIADTNVPKLKEKIRDYLNSQQWNTWKKPEVLMRTITGDELVFPDIVTSQYGKCVVSGAPLVAYCACIFNSSRCHDREPYFKTVWYRNEAEAIKAHDASVAKFPEVKREIREQRELESVKKTGEALKIRLEALYDILYRNNDVDRDLRELISRQRYSYFPVKLVELRAWIVKAEALIADADMASAQLDLRKAKRQAHEKRVLALGCGLAHLLVDEDGLLAINCGKAGRLGECAVHPESGQRTASSLSLDAEGRYCVWQPVPSDVSVRMTEYSPSGKQKSSIQFRINVGQLTEGVWAVVQDSQGVFFYPVIYYKSRKEVVPEATVVVREIKHSALPIASKTKSELLSARNFDPSSLFGGQSKVLQGRKKK